MQGGFGQMPGFVLPPIQPFPPMQQPLPFSPVQPVPPFGFAQPQALTSVQQSGFIPVFGQMTYAGAAPVPAQGHTDPMYYTPAVSSQPMGFAPSSFPAPAASAPYPIASPHISSFSASPPILPQI